MAQKKVFQHLASETETLGLYDKMHLETLKVFKGSDLFVGLTKTYIPLVEGTMILPGEQKEVVTTVMKRLQWHRKSVVERLDYELTRDAGNQVAKADLVIDGKTIAKDLPVTWLLATETRLSKEREILDAMPTLDLSKSWEKIGDGKYKHGPVFINREEKKTVPIVLYNATKEHPAQIKEVTEVKVIGRFDTVTFSGAVHPGLKAALLERLDKVLSALKDARMRANDTLIEDRKLGDQLFDYIYAAEAKE
jgi:hypothetical protein